MSPPLVCGCATAYCAVCVTFEKAGRPVGAETTAPRQRFHQELARDRWPIAVPEREHETPALIKLFPDHRAAGRVAAASRPARAEGSAVTRA